MVDEVNKLLRLTRQGRSGGVALDPNEPDVPASALDAALMFGPVGPAASMAYRGLTAAPKLTGAALAALGLMAPDAVANEGVTQREDLTGLITERNKLQQERDAAVARRDAARPKNRAPSPNTDPIFTEAQNEVGRIEARIAALEQQIAEGNRRNSPEYRLQMDQKRAEAADQERAKRANTPFKELYADYMPYVAPAAALTAGLVGAAIKQPYAARAANEAADISQRWARAAGMTPPSGPGGTAVPTPRAKPDPYLAHEYRLAFPNSPAGGDKAAVAAGIGIGELSQLMPLAIDYQRALPGSPLANQVHEQLTDLPGLAGRMVQGALLGGIPAKIGTKVVDSTYARYYPRYDAETNALLSRTVSPQNLPGGGGGPQLPPAPAVPPAIPQANQPPYLPRGGNSPNQPSPSGSPYRSDVNGPTSRQYIDQLLTSGQSMPANAADELSALMPGVNQASIGPRVEATRPVVDALLGADPATQKAVLDAVLGKPGSKMLGLGAAGAGVAATGAPDPAQADEFTRELATIKALIDGLAAQPAPQYPAQPFQSAVPAFAPEPQNRLLGILR